MLDDVADDGTLGGVIYDGGLAGVADGFEHGGQVAGPSSGSGQGVSGGEAGDGFDTVERRLEATLTADPFAVAPLIIVTVEREAIAAETQGDTLGVTLPFQTDERVAVLGVTAGNDSAQRLQTIVNEA